MYIRTKYEIVKVETIADIQTKVIFKDNFVEQSENLEELLDRYVLYEKGSNDYHIIQAKVLNGGWLQYYKKFYEEITVYGAIWTDKGLIYVAKMNEEGVLCLI